MAGKKDYCVVCVNDGLTKSQASKLLSEYSKAKNNIAPSSRSTAAITTREGIGTLLQKGVKKITR